MYSVQSSSKSVVCLLTIVKAESSQLLSDPASPTLQPHHFATISILTTLLLCSKYHTPKMSDDDDFMQDSGDEEYWSLVHSACETES